MRQPKTVWRAAPPSDLRVGGENAWASKTEREGRLLTRFCIVEAIRGAGDGDRIEKMQAHKGKTKMR